MKIFLSFLQGKPNHPIPAYSFWDFYLKNGLLESQHEFTELPDADWALGLVPQSSESFRDWKSQIWEQTISFLKSNPVDLFLSYLYPKQIEMNAIKEIQKLGIPCVNFFCDNVREFNQLPVEFSVFDLNWVPEYKALSLYKKANYQSIHLPMPMWVDPKYRQISGIELPQLSFIGSHDIQRQLIFESILERSPDLPLNIYGDGWLKKDDTNKPDHLNYTNINKFKFQTKFINQYGFSAYWRKIKHRNYKPTFSTELITCLRGKLSFQNYIEIIKESAITIGVNRYPSFTYPLLKPNTYSRLRDLEAPMLGACYLTEWTEGLDQLYEIGKEIETYKSIDEFIHKSIFLMKNKQKRMQLKISGQQRALEYHTVKKSLAKIENYFK